ncbi:hypothetical protein [Pontibacter roseus]|uniref:hypothetical protein n=1 Tax=Pontibacter roseus TaxID=336989 RepID=UPI00037E132D|nr:hypothetical protein [Pontibacter roseus]
MKSGLYLLPLCFLLLACEASQSEADAVTTDLPATDLTTWVKADLACEEIRNADEDDPLAVVYLEQLGNRHLIDTVYTCSVIAPEMYRTFDIPRHALSASGGWWAGSGDFYYTLPEGDSIAVWHAHRQQQDSLGFQYSVLKRFPATYPGE